jgi:hypothetical protein
VIALAPAQWHERELAHAARADAATAAHRARAARGEKHPIDDFLFTYYSYKPSVLRRWHPGAGADLEDATSSARAAWRWYAPGDSRGSVRVDARGFLAEKALLVDGVERIVRAALDHPGGFGCFGLHEWAMVYRQREHRHPVPLRLGQAETDAVVDAHELRCTHFDAFRFFTAEAVPRNRLRPTRDAQVAMEQPGCLHAGMDVYKWAVKLGPIVPGELLLDAFALARDTRRLDMQASPYDLRAWGAEPVAIETAEGKAEYVRRQRGFAAHGQELRRRLVEALELAREAAAVPV